MIRRSIISIFILAQFSRTRSSSGFLCLIQDSSLNVRCRTILGDALSNCPFLFSEIVRFCQDNLTFLAVKRMSSSEFSSVAKFSFELYWAAARHSLLGFNFGNDFVGFRFLAEPASKLFVNSQTSLLDYFPILPLSSKIEVFKMICEQHQEGTGLNITVNRDNLIESTIGQLSKLSSQERFKKLNIQFEGEQGLDAGGLSRELFFLLCNDLFAPNYGMFIQMRDGKYWFSCRQFQDGLYYRVLGKVFAMALLNDVILPVRFPPVVYKKIQQIPLCLRDLDQIDSEVYHSLISLQESEKAGDDISEFGMTFVVTSTNFGMSVTQSLIERGEEIAVTNENVE